MFSVLSRATALAVLCSVNACSDDGGGLSGATTTSPPNAFAGDATANVEVAGPAFSGLRAFTQDPESPTIGRPAEGTIQLRALGPADAGQSLLFSVGGGVRIGGTSRTSPTLTVSYIGDGVILNSSKGECTVAVERFDGSGASGTAECLDVDIGGSPFTLKATFTVAATGPPVSSTVP